MSFGASFVSFLVSLGGGGTLRFPEDLCLLCLLQRESCSKAEQLHTRTFRQ